MTMTRQEAIEAATELGRFGHHPHPAIDFCAEVDELIGMAANRRAGLPEPTLEDRITRAMEFRVGGDRWAIAAKARLRELETEVK